MIGRSILKKKAISSRKDLLQVYLNTINNPVITDSPEACINAGFAYLAQNKKLYGKEAKEYFLTAQKLDINNLYQYEIGVGLRQTTNNSIHATEFYGYYLEE